MTTAAIRPKPWPIGSPGPHRQSPWPGRREREQCVPRMPERLAQPALHGLVPSKRFLPPAPGPSWMKARLKTKIIPDRDPLASVASPRRASAKSAAPKPRAGRGRRRS